MEGHRAILAIVVFKFKGGCTETKVGREKNGLPAARDLYLAVSISFVLTRLSLFGQTRHTHTRHNSSHKSTLCSIILRKISRV
jgi:hypothetical protein